MDNYWVSGKKLFLVFAGICGLSSYKERSTELMSRLTIPAPVEKPIATKAAHPLRIYLTFDDGPHAGTLEIENVLVRENVPASFFEVGYQATYSPEYKKIGEQLRANSLFRIYNHTFSHAEHNHYNSFYKQPEIVWNDIQKNKQVLNLQSNISRLPGNNVWITPSYYRKGTKQLDKTIAFIEKQNTEYVTGWNVEWHFNNATHKVPFVTTLLKDIDEELRTKRKFPNDIVILAHDFMFSEPENAQKLDSLITFLKNRGDVEFKLIEDHPALHPLDSVQNKPVERKLLASKQ